MQKNIHKILKRQAKPSLFSKLKLWCTYHHVPYTIFTFGIGVFVATLVLVLGGILAGWDIIGTLTSPTALLLYTVLVAVIIIAVFKHFFHKDSR